MASLIVGAGLLIHDKIKSDKAKRKEKKRKGYEARYNELENEHKTNEAAYLQRKATGDSVMLDSAKESLSVTSNEPRRKSSQDSLGSQRNDSNQDGPARWVEEATKDRHPGHR